MKSKTLQQMSTRQSCCFSVPLKSIFPLRSHKLGTSVVMFFPFPFYSGKNAFKDPSIFSGEFQLLFFFFFLRKLFGMSILQMLSVH